MGRKKREILLIVPAFLRKQWEGELRQKFYLSSHILDSKTTGRGNPFEPSEEILICSYQFASQRADQLKKHWDLVVIDEAHRMRNVYKGSNKHKVRNAHDCALILGSLQLLRGLEYHHDSCLVGLRFYQHNERL